MRSRLILFAIACFVLSGAGIYLAPRTARLYHRLLLPETVAANAHALYRDGVSPVAGDPDGTVDVVVFTDYNCPYCREGEPAIERLTDNDRPGVRVIFKELPLLGVDSVAVARLALAAKQQGDYWPFRKALFAQQGHMTPARALDIAKRLGLNTERLVRDAQSYAITRTLNANERLAQAIGIPGVPYYLVGDQQVTEGPNLYQRLLAAIATARQDEGDDRGASGCGNDCAVHASLE